MPDGGGHSEEKIAKKKNEAHYLTLKPLNFE